MWVAATMDKFLGRYPTKRAAIEAQDVGHWRIRRFRPGGYHLTRPSDHAGLWTRRSLYVMTEDVARAEGFDVPDPNRCSVCGAFIVPRFPMHVCRPAGRPLIELDLG